MEKKKERANQIGQIQYTSGQFASGMVVVSGILN